MHLMAFGGRQRSKRLQKNIAQLEQDFLWYSRDCSQHFGVFAEKDINFKLQVAKFRQRLFFRCGLFWLSHCILLSCVNYPLISDILNLRDRFLTVFSFQLIQAKYAEYCSTILIVKEFVGALQQSLLLLRFEIIRHQPPCPGKVGKHFPFYGKLMANQFLLSRVWFLVQYIEDYFGLPMLILFLYNGVAITHTINWMYVRSFALDDKDSLEGYRFYFILLVFIGMFWACWLTQECTDKYNQLSSILGSFKIHATDVALKNRQREYSLQLLHQKLDFSCWGFFDMNLKYFGLMALAVTTYVFILIQFKLQAETEKGNLRL
ncbi:putative gustatory receptor 98b [Musca vetustissima]|uniref:putative gustatory receptor 98b n=1 Tax=Musca vetustissima TaxID=27455 RepID=UPI002AB64395|nr:putative gustatory receptor 98b [Musca vetustissima]